MNMPIHPKIREFLEKRKADKVKADTKDSMTEEEVAEIHLKYSDRFALESWLPDAAKRAGQISISTHPCKFSHPDAAKNKNGETSSVISHPPKRLDGYLHSGNVPSNADASGNAAALDVYQFLHIEIEGMTFLDHLKEETEVALNALKGVKSSSYSELRQGFLAMVQSTEKNITSSKIKQVYFPTSDEKEDTEYHLLSTLSNSGIIYEMRSRLDDMHFSDKTKELREKKKNSTYTEDSYKEVYDYVTTGYGGTQPQNISVHNSTYSGKAYLLPSSPPLLERRMTSFPKKDFFTQCLYYKQLVPYFERLHSYFIDGRNNMEVRNKYDHILEELLMYVILPKTESVRSISLVQYFEASCALPMHQKIWLLDTAENRAIRDDSDDWLDPLLREMTRWIISSYTKLIGDKKAHSLGEAEFKDLLGKLNHFTTYLR